MPKTSKQIAKILLIEASVNRLSETAKGLSFLAEQAYLNRDYKPLRAIAEKIPCVSDEFADIGLYFQALAESKNGSGDMTNVYKAFSRLADSSSSKIRAASLLFLGRDYLHYKNYRMANQLFAESANLALLASAPLTFVNAQNAHSVSLAENGDYEESIKLIKSIEPLIQMVGRIYPVVFGEYCNNMACNYLDLNELDLASYYSNKAVSMKVSANYREWYETRKEVEEKLRQRDF
jgi:hypothetical protein